jgi:hypothetical protein
MGDQKVTVPKGYRVIFRAWKTLKDGTRDYAKDHGLRCWLIVVPIGK